MRKNFQYIVVELIHHLPFSVAGVISGIILMGVLTFLAILVSAEEFLAPASGELFHVFHAGHILFSAVTTTAMFWKHEKRLVKAVVVGFVGSIGICTLSDIILPFAGGLFLSSAMNIHICALEHPGLVLIFAIAGVLAGLAIPKSIERSTEYSHSAHVFLSSVASILYLLAFGVHDWIHFLGGVFLITVVAVMIPCCASDIVFPLACVHKK